MQSGFALVINDMQNLPQLDGAVVELTVCGPGMLGADIRIPGHQRHDDDDAASRRGVPVDL